MKAQSLVLIILIFIANVGSPGSSSAEALRVVASIKPVHSLVAAVMDGVGEPYLLIKGSASPHSHALRPSEIRELNEADLVFWVGPDFEVFLQKPLQSLPPEALNVAFMDKPPVIVLPGRDSEFQSVDDQNLDVTREHTHARDGHIWLDPANAIAMVEVIAQSLRQADAANAKTYSDNAKATVAALKNLDTELSDLLAPVQTKPFLVFHDAFQYFEKKYELNSVGFVVVTPEQMTSAKRVVELKTAIEQLRPTCIYSEPAAEPALINIVLEGADMRLGTLDPAGLGLSSGPGFYFNLMRKLAYDFSSCLSETGRNVQ